MTLHRRALLAGFVGGLIIPQRAFAIVRSESLMRIKPVVQWSRFPLTRNEDVDSRVHAALRKMYLNSVYGHLGTRYAALLQDDISAGKVAAVIDIARERQALLISKSPNLAR